MENTSDSLNAQAGGPPASEAAQEPALIIQVPGGDAAQEEEDVEYEYVYEDEHGNPIEAPEEGFDPEHFEEELVGVVDENGVLTSENAESEAEAPEEDDQEYDQEYEEEHQPVQETEAEEEIVDTDSVASETAKAETVNIPPRSRSSRRNRSGRGSGRPSSRASSTSTRQRPSASRRSSAIRLKHAKIKTYLMLGSLIAIPALIIAIIAVCYSKGFWPFSARTVTRHVENDYQAGDGIAQQAKSKFYAAFRKYRAGSLPEDAYYKTLKSCEASLDAGIRLLIKSREQNPGEKFYYIDQKIQDANLKARTVREEIFIIENRKMLKNR
jgi:hypothetical protein